MGDIVGYSTDHEFKVVRRLGDDGGAMNQGIAIVMRLCDRRILVRKTFRETGNLDSSPKDWLREMKLLQRVNHPNICAFAEASVTNSVGRLYMEFCDLGNLEDFKENMNRLRKPVPEDFAWHVLKSLTKALCYIHWGLRDTRDFLSSRPQIRPGWECILHRDIKSNNVFIKPRGGPQPYPEIKLGDFGLAIGSTELAAQTARNGHGIPVCRLGAGAWLAPEFPQCGERTDVFSVGAVIQHICKCTPWNKVNPEGGIAQGYSSTLDKIVIRAMARDREQRPFCAQLARMAYSGFERVNPPYTRVPSQAYGRLLE
ncbi:hypothetical protein FQN54_006029 [Arachnomyces sp. PD_36]|nr:hypothetical protein FQN54_006029 [Arachnomyces sp. PD_36]